MQVIDAGQAQPLGDDAKAHAVVLLARVGAVAGAVHVQDHVVAALARVRSTAEGTGRDPARIGWQGSLAIPADRDFDSRCAPGLDDASRTRRVPRVGDRRERGTLPAQHLDVIAEAGAALRDEVAG